MESVIERARKYLTPALVFHTGVVADRGEGAYIIDTGGKRYLDFTCGLATTSVGHSPPEVVEAVKAQAEKFLHSGCIFHYPGVGELAEKLSTITPKGIEQFFFANSGAEAVEGAIKLARFHTGRQGIIAFTDSFHGRTTGALSLTASSARYRSAYMPLLPGVYHAPYPHCYRCPMGQERESCKIDCFEYLKNILRKLISPEEVACVVFEPILGEGGYVVPPREYVEGLYALCKETGILFVADEVQTGFARTGRWFASTRAAIEPDIITLGKAIGAGLPLSAVGSSRKIIGRWSPGSHGTTFGGNPLSCAAALASIEMIEENKLWDNARDLGEHGLKRLREAQNSRPVIGDVRGAGLMIGIELVEEDGSPAGKFLEKVIKKCTADGLLLVECGTEKNVLRLMPPLIITKEELDEALDIILAAIDELS